MRKATGVLLASLWAMPSLVQAEAVVRLYCEDDNSGATVYLNGNARGSCPSDLFLPAGSYTLQARKMVDAEQERVFETTLSVADDEVKRVEILLSPPRLTQDAQARRAQQAQKEAAALRQRQMQNEFEQAEKGDMAAVKSVIRRYQQGDGVSKNPAEAERWTRRLVQLQQIDANATLAQAENDSIEAMQKMAQLYRSGEGVPASEEQARAWTEKAQQRVAADAAQKKAEEDLKAFRFLPISHDFGNSHRPPQDPGSASTWIVSTGIPSLLVLSLTDLVTLPFRLPEYNRLKKAAAGHAAAWQTPDSLLARAYAQRTRTAP